LAHIRTQGNPLPVGWLGSRQTFIGHLLIVLRKDGGRARQLAIIVVPAALTNSFPKLVFLSIYFAGATSWKRKEVGGPFWFRGWTRTPKETKNENRVK
jgi:hypothetical protein